MGNSDLVYIEYKTLVKEYNPEKDNPFDFAKDYSGPEVLKTSMIALEAHSCLQSTIKDVVEARFVSSKVYWTWMEEECM